MSWEVQRTEIMSRLYFGAPHLCVSCIIIYYKYLRCSAPLKMLALNTSTKRY